MKTRISEEILEFTKRSNDAKIEIDEIKRDYGNKIIEKVKVLDDTIIRRSYILVKNRENIQLEYKIRTDREYRMSLLLELKDAVGIDMISCNSKECAQFNIKRESHCNLVGVNQLAQLSPACDWYSYG